MDVFLQARKTFVASESSKANSLVTQVKKENNITESAQWTPVNVMVEI